MLSNCPILKVAVTLNLHLATIVLKITSGEIGYKEGLNIFSYNWNPASNLVKNRKKSRSLTTMLSISYHK